MTDLEQELLARISVRLRAGETLWAPQALGIALQTLVMRGLVAIEARRKIVITAAGMRAVEKLRATAGKNMQIEGCEQ